MLKNDVVFEHENYIAEPLTKGVTTEAMGLVNSGALVKRIYEGASPFAFVREFIQNSLDAGATRVEVGPDFVGVKTAIEMGNDPVYKLSFADNGEGIKRSKMKGLLNNLSSSDRSMEANGNFGIGAKVAALPWNPYGINFMSWTKDGEAMVRLFRRHDGNYGLFRFNENDDTGDNFNDLTDPPKAYQDSWQKPSGTTVVLLGRDAESDTLFGPADQEAGLFGLMHVINDRYFVFPEDAKVSVCVFENSAKSKWPKTKAEARKYYRQAQGSKWFLDKHSKESGVVKGEGVKVHWWWHPDAKSTGFDSYTSQLGYVGALYDGELYDTYRRTKVGKRRTYPYSLVAMYAKFGLFFEDVWNNVTLVVEPDIFSDKRPNGVIPDLSRGHLKSAAGEPMPWDQWGQLFAANLPPVIADAIDKASEGTGSTINLDAKLKEYFDRMDIYSGLDKTVGGASGGGCIVPRRKKVGTVVNKSPNDNAGEFRPTKYHVPARQWVKSSKLAKDQDLFVGKAVFYSEGNNTVLFNEDFPLWKQMADHWVSKYPGGVAGLAAKVREAVRYVYESAVVSRIVHIRQFKGRPDWNAQSIEKSLSNESLTMVVLGLQDADTRLGNYLKGTIRMRRDQEAGTPNDGV